MSESIAGFQQPHSDWLVSQQSGWRAKEIDDEPPEHLKDTSKLTQYVKKLGIQINQDIHKDITLQTIPHASTLIQSPKIDSIIEQSIEKQRNPNI